jgi:hypothetical protein
LKKTCALATLVFCLSASSVLSQNVDVPFAGLDRQLNAQPGGWNGDKSTLSKIFAEERRQLGNEFESKLLKYLDRNPEKHYWISVFLTAPGYLHGEKPLPELSLLILQQGLSLLRGKSDRDSLGRSVSFGILAAIRSQKSGFAALAVSYKNDAERQLATDSIFSAFVPGVSEDDAKIYDEIKADFGPKKRWTDPNDEFPDRPKPMVHAGYLNTRATSLPLPVYPESLKASGEVMVDIVFDGSGKVIWAHATSGPVALQKFAEAAALKATFRPVLLAGKPQTVDGRVIYRFPPN